MIARFAEMSNGNSGNIAYRVHTDIGNKCTGAKVNDKIAPLDTPLKSSDVVEIIKDKNRKGPNPDWLSFVKTNSAQEHIRKAKKK